MNDTIKSTYYYGGNAFKHSVGKDKAYCIGDYSKVPVRNLDAIKSIEVIDNDDNYVYEIETETHWYSAGDVLTHNCAVPEALLYFDYFARKEWGDDYYLHTEDIVNPRSQHPRTIREQIHQHFQQVVYSINQPAAARGLQSAFVNFSYYDKAFYEGMFGNFVFPDFTKPIWESFNWLQKDFMQWFNDERKKCILTFPVESFAMVYQDHEFLDPESADFVAEEYARGHSFFTYISDTVDSLSSCCFEGDEVISIQEPDTAYFIKISDFVDGISSIISQDGHHIENSQYKILSFKDNGEVEHVTITGILKKKYSGNMFTIKTDSSSIKITEDHLVLVRDLQDDTIKQVPAGDIYMDPDRYLIAIED